MTVNGQRYSYYWTVDFVWTKWCFVGFRCFVWAFNHGTYQSKGCDAAGKVTVGLASHWPCVTDLSGISIYGLNGQRMGDEHPAWWDTAWFFMGHHPQFHMHPFKPIIWNHFLGLNRRCWRLQKNNNFSLGLC